MFIARSEYGKLYKLIPITRTITDLSPQTGESSKNVLGKYVMLRGSISYFIP
jgi:hypothetical protein